MELTVFTPTYNRAYILDQLYQSLRRQSSRCFEWLIVDDGSTDNTEALVCDWIKQEGSFPIRYYKQENGGKHRAINRGLELAKGRLFFTVDSDDYLTDDAVEKILTWDAELPQNGEYCGFAGNLGTGPNITPNRMFDKSYIGGTALDRYSTVDGERAMVFFTDIHRKYLYPTFPGENFMTEAVVWNRMAHDGYKIRFFNDIIWIYEYQEDGLTKAGNSVFLNNPRGYGLWLKEKADFQGVSFKQRVKMWYTFASDLYHLYDAKLIAEYIGAPNVLVHLIVGIRRLVDRLRR